MIKSYLFIGGKMHGKMVAMETPPPLHYLSPVHPVIPRTGFDSTDEELMSCTPTYEVERYIRAGSKRTIYVLDGMSVTDMMDALYAYLLDRFIQYG